MNIDELWELTDAIAGELTPIADNAPDVCPVCRTNKGVDYDVCSSCWKVLPSVSAPTEHVIPITYYRRDSLLRERMHGYKDAEDPTARYQHGAVVAGILTRYLLTHGAALADIYGEWDEIVAVPSSRHDPPSALEIALREHSSDLLPMSAPVLGPGPGRIARNSPAEDGFEAVADVGGWRVLLIDDTYTTGSHLQSAATLLQNAGADVIASVVVARKINPDPQWGSQDLWDRQAALRYDFDAQPWWQR